MSLQFIIDGYNVVNHPLFANLNKKIEDKPSALLDFIRVNKLCGKSGNRAMVVFDGYADSRQQPYAKPDIAVVFSGQESADERIKKMLEESRLPKNIVVVSDDKEIIFFARYAGSKPLPVEVFLSRAPAVRRIQAGRQKGSGGRKEDEPPKVSYTSMQKINQELRKLWLK